MSNPGLNAILLLLGSLTLSPAEAAQVTVVVNAAQGAPAGGSTSPATAEGTVAVPDDATGGGGLSDGLGDDADSTSDSGDEIDEVTAPIIVTAAAPAIPPPVPEGVQLEVPLDLATIPARRIVSGGEVRFQKTYNGVTFDVPPAGATGRFYLITMGLRIGIFNTWQRTSPYALGVSRASFSRIHSLRDGYIRMKVAIDSGEAEYLT